MDVREELLLLEDCLGLMADDELVWASLLRGAVTALVTGVAEELGLSTASVLLSLSVPRLM